jgi:predicted nucleic acid-binding protein
VIVIDASVLCSALTDDGPIGRMCRLEMIRDDRWAAPDHLFVETFSAIRGRLSGGKITEVRAEHAIAALCELTIDLMDTVKLLSTMWDLRANVSGYDAAYVAAAEALRCALVTADGKLARSDAVECEIRLIRHCN